MNAPRTARVRREERRASLGASLRTALDLVGMSQAEAAALVGVDPSTFGRWADAHDPLSISVSDLAALPVEVRIAIVRRELLADHIVVPEPAGLDEGCDLRQAAEAMRAASEVAASALDAWADGRMTRGEAEPLVERCNRAIALFVAVRERAELAAREGVIGVRAPLRVVSSDRGGR